MPPTYSLQPLTDRFGYSLSHTLTCLCSQFLCKLMSLRVFYVQCHDSTLVELILPW